VHDGQQEGRNLYGLDCDQESSSKVLEGRCSAELLFVVDVLGAWISKGQLAIY